VKRKKWKGKTMKKALKNEKAGMKGVPQSRLDPGLADGRTVTPVRRLAPLTYGRNLRIAGKSRADSPIAR